MKKHLFITLLAVLLLAAPFGSDPAQAQGTVPLVPPPTVSGTVGNNGWYTSDVTVYWDTSTFDPTWKIIEGCADVNAPEIINSDTTATGVDVICIVENPFNGAQSENGANIKRDATPPVLELVSPAQNPASANEGSTLTLQAVAQDLNPVTVGWDLDEDGTIDAPNPTSVTIPGLKGTVAPCWIAVDEAGNVSQITVEVNIINLPPNIDGWVVPTMIHFGGAVQLTATTSDPGDDPRTALVDWGDGQVEPVMVKPDGSLQAEHTYAGAGDYQVSLILSDDEGLTVSDSRNVMVYSPIETIEVDLIPGTLNLVNQGILNEGQANSLVVKLEGAVTALRNDRPSAPQKLGAYLNEYEASVPDAVISPCFLLATDVRDALILNGWVPQPD